MKLREEEENEKMKQIEEKMKLENNYIEEKIKEEDEENSPEKKQSNKKIKENNYNLDEKIENYLNKSMNLIPFRSKSTKDYQNINQNINEIMTSRKYLNDLYNRDKKIINHSFIQSSSPANKSVPKFSNQRNIEVFYKYKNKSKTKLKNNNPTLSSIDNDSTSLYDPKTKSLRYKHYTEGGVCNYNYTSINNNNINNNNISQNYHINNSLIHNYDNNNNNYHYNDSSSPDQINKNSIYINSPQRNLYNINNKIDYSNDINKFNNEKNYEEEINEKNNDINMLYKKEYNYRNNQINKIENELKENNILNQKLLNEAQKINNNDNEFKKILLQNESINNIFNELDNESLMKYREENNQKLFELNQKKVNKKTNSNIPEFLQKQFEESKDAGCQLDKDIYNKINEQKYRNILIGEQEKIENNLDYYNKELKLNEKKKELLLNKMFGDNYTKNRRKINNKNYKDTNLTENNSFGVNKYLVKNNEINLIGNNTKIENNKYKFIYSPYKTVGGIKMEVKKEDIFNDDQENDIMGSFDFQRKHHFS